MKTRSLAAVDHLNDIVGENLFDRAMPVMVTPPLLHQASSIRQSLTHSMFP